MDKIDGLGTGGFLFRPDIKSKTPEDPKKKNKATRTFLGLFESKSKGIEYHSEDPGLHKYDSGAELDEVLAGYMDEIHTLGNALIQFPGRTNLAAYRSVVSGFLKLITSHAYDTEEHTSNRNILNQKKYTLVISIDKKLEQLAVGLLQSQSLELSILSQVEEINGMLFDLLQ